MNIHACREHWHQDPGSENTGEVPLKGREGEELDVTGGMPPAAQSLLPLCSLGGLTDGRGGDINPEKDSQSPDHQVTATLLEDVRVRQE